MGTQSSAPDICTWIKDPQSLPEPHSRAVTSSAKLNQKLPAAERIVQIKTEMATLVMLLLGTWMLTATGAPAVSRLPSDCKLTRFQSLPPQELQAFKRAKDALEEMLQLKGWNCSGRLFPGKRDLKQLQVWERPMALEAELSLTLQVLGAMAEPSLGPVLDTPLRTLKLIHIQLQPCVPPESTGMPLPRGRLQHWLQRLQEAPHKESQSCLEASVTFNLFRLLTHDLRCVALGALCV